jgi:BirA family transcriptional regulator, biotin operon repressor / biotin---[acetyl-CoA-carboxylase] ligase
LSRYDGLDARAVERLTGAPLVVLADSIPSTQDEVQRLAAAGAPSGAVVLADEQTAGRGRQGRAWHSPAGAGVWLSLLLRPRQRPEGGALAIRAGLAAIAAVAEAAPAAAARLKWPNDLVVAGRKVGGILCEARWSGAGASWVVVGVGINVVGRLAPELRDRATALADVSPGVSRLSLVAALVPRLRALEPLPPVLDAGERRDFLRLEWRERGAPETVDIDPSGALLVRSASGALDRRVAAS